MTEFCVNEEFGESAWMITSPEYKGVKVFGYTLEEAKSEFDEALIAWHEMEEEVKKKQLEDKGVDGNYR